MKKKLIILKNFTNGEIDSTIHLDESIISTSAKSIQNMIVAPNGTLIRRPPSQLISTIINNEPMKIVSLEHNNTIIHIHCYCGFFDMGVYDGLNTWQWRNNMGKNDYNQSDINTLSFVTDSENKKIYLLTKNHPPCVISYGDNMYFNFSKISFIDGPYDDINTDGTKKLTPSALSGYNVELSSSWQAFSGDQVGEYIRISHGSSWGVCKIVSYVSSTKVMVSVIVPFEDTASSTQFRFNIWNNNNGYPSVGYIANGRLYLGNSPRRPQTLWASKIFDYYNFSPSVKIKENNVVTEAILEDNAFTINMLEGKELLWITSVKNNIVVGLQEAIITIGSLLNNEAISPTNYYLSKISDTKSSSLMLKNSFLTFFVNYYKRDIYALEFTAQRGIVYKNIVKHSKHLFKSPIKDMLLIDYPFSMLWVLLENGDLLCANVCEDSQTHTYAWSKHVIGGSNIQIKQISSCYVQNKAVLFLHVQRGNMVDFYQSLEMITFEDLNYTLENYTLHHIDGYISGSIQNNQIILDTTCFNQKRVSVILIKDNAYVENNLVSQGTINICNNYENQNVIIGYQYSSSIITHDLEDNDIIQDSKKIDNIVIKTINTNSFSICVYENNQKQSIYDASVSNVNKLNTYHLYPDKSFEKIKNLEIAQYNPLCFNLSFIKIALSAI